jgi:hypothetical protein
MKRTIQNLAFFATITLCLISCEKGKNETKISKYNSTESHNQGQNCMACHVKGGKGEGYFQVAGTVHDTTLTKYQPNSTVYLYTQQGGQGTLKYTIEVDGLGNFYTTETIDFGSGLYPTVKSSTGERHMSSPITTGTCNSCHGYSTSKLWVD